MAKVSEEYVEKSFHKRFVKMAEPERLGVLKVLNTLNEALTETDEPDDTPADAPKKKAPVADIGQAKPAG